MKTSHHRPSLPVRNVSLLLVLLATLEFVPAFGPGPARARAQGSTSAAAPASAATLSGRVVDASTGLPLADARVRLWVGALVRDTATGPDGGFRFDAAPAGDRRLEVSRLGYRPLRLALGLDVIGAREIRLEPQALAGPSIEVTTTRPSARGSAVAFTRLEGDEVREKYWAQDVPMLLAETPGVHAYSDAGNGIGYSYVKVRGFNQRRVAVTINGVPLNDPMSHEVYWVDHPDLLASARSVQVQRGVGSALYGASAVGGSINLETSGTPGERRLAIESGAGSYGTTRFSVQGETGLLENRYAFSGRYSRIVSEDIANSRGRGSGPTPSRRRVSTRRRPRA